MTTRSTRLQDTARVLLAFSICAVFAGGLPLQARSCPESLSPTQSAIWIETLGDRISDFSDRPEVNIVLLGDTGTPRTFSRVARGVAALCEDEVCDLGLLLGDNFYIGLTRRGPRTPNSRAFERHFYEPLSNLHPGFDIWPLLGNHDYQGCPQAQINHTYLGGERDGPDWLMPDNNFSIPNLPTWLNIFALDTNVLTKRRHRVNTAAVLEETERTELTELKNALCGKEGWRILAGHHPIYSTGQHGNDKETTQLRRVLDPQIKACGVHFFLSGHDHNQEVIEADGFVQVVQGAGSRLRRQSNLDLPADARSLGFWKLNGFGIMSFSKTRATLRLFKVSEDTEKLNTMIFTKTWLLASGRPK